jgi:hypothetical protein
VANPRRIPARWLGPPRWSAGRKRKARTLYTPSRQKKRTRARGWILARQLTNSPKAEAVRADILDRLRQHEREDTLPRGGRGLFYDLRPHGMPGNPRGITYTKHPAVTGRYSMEATPQYVTEMLAEMRRVYDPGADEWLIPEDWIADARSPIRLSRSKLITPKMQLRT